MPIRILIVSDLPISAAGIRALTLGSGDRLIIAEEARNSVEAVQVLAREAVDVILLDLDGDNKVESIPLLIAGEARLIVVSASQNFAHRDEAILAGASGALDKREPWAVMQKAIEKVHAGEFWVDRSATMRILKAAAQQRAGGNPEHDKILLLTRKEKLAVEAIARDGNAGNRDIAERLNISEHTLRNHLSSIYAKLGVAGRMGLYAFAHRNGLLGKAS